MVKFKEVLSYQNKNNNAKNTVKVKNLSKELEQELIDLLIF